jgi:Mn-dependent DtxR family transcriptional regulator
LGVENEAAEQEACIMEHHLSEATLERISLFVDHVTSCPGGTGQGADCIVKLRDDLKLKANGSGQ